MVAAPIALCATLSYRFVMRYMQHKQFGGGSHNSLDLQLLPLGHALLSAVKTGLSVDFASHHIRTGYCSAHRDVVVAGRDVGRQRAERVEGRLVAPLQLLAHVLGDLVQRNCGQHGRFLRVAMRGVAWRITSLQDMQAHTAWRS